MTEKYIRISMSKVNIPESVDLQNGSDVRIVIYGEVVKVEYPATQSEDEEIVYVIKGISAESINGEEI